MDEIEETIRSAYRTGAFGACGWRHLTSPLRAMAAPFCFVGINPGGRPAEGVSGAPVGEADEVFAPERHAMLHEGWAGHPPGEAPLQRQYRLLCEAFGEPPETTLAFNLTPFRSVDVASLPGRERAFAFGARIAHATIDEARGVRRFAICGKEAGDRLGVEHEWAFPTGWGAVKMHRGTLRGRPAYVFPHLSRFGLFGRPGFAPLFEAMLTAR